MPSRWLKYFQYTIVFVPLSLSNSYRLLIALRFHVFWFYIFCRLQRSQVIIQCSKNSFWIVYVQALSPLGFCLPYFVIYSTNEKGTTSMTYIPHCSLVFRMRTILFLRYDRAKALPIFQAFTATTTTTKTRSFNYWNVWHSMLLFFLLNFSLLNSNSMIPHIAEGIKWKKVFVVGERIFIFFMNRINVCLREFALFFFFFGCLRRVNVVGLCSVCCPHKLCTRWMI